MNKIPKDIVPINNADAIPPLQKCSKPLSKKKLINTLNFINFQDKKIYVIFTHLEYGTPVSVEAKPLPCVDGNLECRWVNNTGLEQQLKSCKISHLSMWDGHTLICFYPELKTINEQGASFVLPELCYEFNMREVRRFPCNDVQVEFIQNSILFSGDMLDFSARSFRIALKVTPPQSCHWINAESTGMVILKREREIVFSGECKIVRQSGTHMESILVLKPLSNRITRFKPKQYRSVRRTLSPSPVAVFMHPLVQKLITLDIEDISGSGFSVKELYNESLLLPGMIISSIEIEFANDHKITCTGQVLHKNVHTAEDGTRTVKCGLAFLNLAMHDQTRLFSLINRTINNKSFICNKVDLEDLWRFFFDAGFIYPQKYAAISSDKYEFKKTYEKLYHHNPHIARHFIYQDNGKIQGHISMLRIFEATWLFQHHASIAAHSKAGLIVLNQIAHYVNDFYRLRSSNMNFVICYFRADNKFPSRIFGGVSNAINDRKACSIDNLAYLHFPKNLNDPGGLGEQTLPSQARREDIMELQSFYEHLSGGLMLSACDLDPDSCHNGTITEEYEKAGFARQRRIFSIKKDGDVKAILSILISDDGLSLSSFTNCIHVYVIDQEGLSIDSLYSSLSLLANYYKQEKIPVLLYPFSYAQKYSIPCEKIYSIWVLNIALAGEQYLNYVNNIVGRLRYE